MTDAMKAVQITRYGGPEAIDGTVVVRVRAFGANHAEAYFRTGAWGDVARISGIECVGQVHHPGGAGWLSGSACSR